MKRAKAIFTTDGAQVNAEVMIRWITLNIAIHGPLRKIAIKAGDENGKRRIITGEFGE